MTVKELIEHLKTYDPNMVCAAPFWQPEDVKLRAHDNGIELTDDQCNKVIEFVQRTADCELGITWITIDCATDEILREE